MSTKNKREQAARNMAKAMSHQARADALKILNERTASAKEIAEQIGEEVGYVGYHVRQLLALGCIEKVCDRRVRGAVETFYRAVESPIVDTEDGKKSHKSAGLALSGSSFSRRSTTPYARSTPVCLEPPRTST